VPPSVTSLDARDAPALVAGAGPGDPPAVYLLGDAGEVLASRVVFEGSFRGGVAVAADGDRVYVGAGPGGGPRLVTLTADLANKIDDRFVGDPSSRGGLSLAGITRSRDPAIPADPPTDGPLPVYLDFPPDFAAAGAVAARFAELADPLDRFAVTLRPPDRPPGDYLTVVYQDRLTWAAADEPQGIAPGRLDTPPGPGRQQPRAVYARLADGFGGVRGVGGLAATGLHEALHAVGLGHADDETNLMYRGGTTAASTRLDPDQVGDARAAIDDFLGRRQE
jgi:hypothetical protein